MTLAARPNILLVVFDSLSAAALEQHADSLPTLSALGAQGVSFANAYACSPESSPARATLFTGLDMAAHGLWTDGVALPRHETPLSEVFSRNGYKTWLVGRRQLSGVSNWTTEHAREGEFTAFDWAHGPLHRSRQNAYLDWLKQTTPESYGKIFPSQPNPDDTDIPPNQRRAIADLPNNLSFNNWIATQFSARLNTLPDQTPFFGIAGFVVGETMGARPAGGTPFEVCDKRALRQADAGLARLLEAVPGDTTVVVTAGRGSEGDGNPMHDDAIRVPLIIRAPGHPAETIVAPVSTMDIAPTLYEAAGITCPKRVQGQSLLTAAPRGWAFARLRCPGMPHVTALVTERWKLVLSHDPSGTNMHPDYRLYDRQADPSETTNLATSPAHDADLEDMIDQMMDARVALEDRTQPRIAMF